MSDSFSERMRRRWARRGMTPDDTTTGGPSGPDLRKDADGPQTPLTPAQRAANMYTALGDAYERGDVAAVRQISSLMPDSPEAEPFRSYARVLAAEAAADDLLASETARMYLESIAPGHPEWDTARKLYGEVTVQGLVLGRILLDGNLDGARGALAEQGAVYRHPSGATIRLEPDEEEPLLLLLDGDVPRAVRAARRQLRRESRTGTPAGLADALCTLALCVCADGAIDSAREALDRAERVLPGRPRIAVTRERVETSPAARRGQGGPAGPEAPTG